MYSCFSRSFFAAALATCVLTWVMAAPVGAGETGRGDSGDTVIAIVDGERIHLSDLDLALGMLPPEYQTMPVELIYSALLDQLVDSKLIETAGRRENLQNGREVRGRMKKAENRIIQKVYLSQYVEPRLTERWLRAHYDEFVETTLQHEEIRARHILKETKAQAEEIIRELENGADFAELAKRESIAPEAVKGGDLDYFTRDEMVPEFSEVAFAIETGSFSEKPVRTSYGWHVIKVEDRRRIEPPSFEEARTEVRTGLAQKILGELVAELRKKATIRLFRLDGSPMSDGSGN